ncbi:glycoside hydrolase family 31 protein [Clostridium sp. YIM B02505]|uniref:Glycoside hydrolase family 31 protein n=1 Tax=Clostridium yunnanense TaxID=2800325 RepID=A0ABS1EP95_9CLOT|nr:glycoside hydrolase family 31 protein [Clostridium yunnanense]MBK1811175.1 glycoside hydrolase family 31 protein [Clostridium yunnanense]
MFGKIISHKVKNNKIHLEFEENKGIVEVINPIIVNVFCPLKYDDHYSRAIEDLSIEQCEIIVEKKDSCIEIRTEALLIRVYDDFKVDFYSIEEKLLCEDYREERNPFLRRGTISDAQDEGHNVDKQADKHKIQVVKRLFGDEKFYGLGEKTGHLNKRGYYYEMWNTDDPTPHVESHKSLYKSIPFFITLRDESVFGIFFDNTFKTYFDMGKENSKYYYFGADNGNLDYYFIGGNNVQSILKGYTDLTGKTPLPQMWTLGYQQSRWAYSPASRVKEIAKNFREKGIPCDTIHLDIDYMENFKVFTWDKERFPDEKKLLNNLSEDGFKIVTIIDPGVKKEKNYDIYETGLKNGYFATEKDGITYVNKVWPGDSVFPDFSKKDTRDWWAENQKLLLDSGVSGVWNDMNEPASFNGPLPDDVQFENEGRNTDHTEIHNVYGHLMSKATFEGIKKHSGKRPFVITRAAYAGTQKYSTVWTGDNQSFWDHLRMSIPMLLNLGMSGISFCGTDVGGFSFDCTPELLSRWVQIGAFTPLFRNHSGSNTRDQEPWAFDEETLNINRKFIKLRYKLLPYLYDLLWSGETTGLPVMRSLVLHYEKDKEVHEINDQFLFGENILVAPILEQGKKIRSVYLPEGEWFDYWTKEVIAGGKYILKEAPLDICPLYIKKGSIVPNYPEQNYVGEKDIKELTLDIYPGEGQYVHYVDDKESYKYREGEYTLYELIMKDNEEVTININIKQEQYKAYDNFKVIYNCNTIKEIYFNEEKLSFSKTDNKIEFSIPAVSGKIILK